MPNRTIIFKRAIAKLYIGSFYLFKKFEDDVTASELITWSLTKPVSEDLGITDEATLGVSKPFSEAASVTDATTLSAGKNLTEGLALSDTTTLSATKPFSDTITISESGLVVAQDYCDITYFSQDFVGQSSTIQRHKMLNEKLNIKGDVVLVLTDENGNLKQRQEINNLVVTSGLDYISDKIASSVTTVSNLAVGTGTAAVSAGQTALGNEIERNTFSSSSASNGVCQFNATFAAGEATGAISEAGIFNATSGGVMLCRTRFDAVNKAAGDSLAITWVITISV